MATVRDLLAIKGSAVATIAADVTAYDAAVRMNEKKIGCLVVLDGDRLVGVFTERDILQRIVAGRRDPLTTRVDEVMTTEVVCGRVHTSLEEARGVMKNRRIRHMPILGDNDELLGLISIGDLNAHEATSHERTIHLLHQYIYGPV